MGTLGSVQSILTNANDEEVRIKILNYRNDVNRTPLHSLILKGNVTSQNQKLLLALLKNGADANAQDYYGADTNLQNIFGETLLHKIYLSHRSPFRKEYFSSSSESDPCPDLDYYACNEKIILALDHGSDINIVDNCGQTCMLMIGEDVPWERDYALQDCYITLWKHMKKLETLGFTVKKINWEAYESDEFIREFCEEHPDCDEIVDECRKELELMRSSNIDRYTNLCDILYKNSHEMHDFSF
ncbi:hypothetical protein QAD02_001238 [Eretmocerus hayati]|uniref:Uncharacterized protein n=1 Tax=Eretmocerus hayati TaxID=131215 RepID=A0ACC2NI26_9HYME|nr:hypothetical protein QAD02_001238 [Eretmocerus hayati]